LVYVAELKAADKTDKDPYRKYRFNPDLGEGFIGKCNPAIFLLRWSPSSLPELFRLSIPGLEHVRFVQPIFDPVQSRDVLYATGYELTIDKRALGIKYCFNRPAGIWKLTIPQSSSQSPSVEGDANNSTKPVVIDIESTQKLSPSHLSCRSPRVLDTGERFFLIWLACTCGGAHASTTTLHMLDITLASNKIDLESLRAAEKPLVGVVREPLKDTSTFPGLFTSCIASSPLISYGDGADRQHGILLSSQWGSRTTILRVCLRNGDVQEVTPVTDGKLYSWSLLATDGGNSFVCSRSAPDVPYEIMLGRFQENGEVDWLLLNKPVLRKNGQS
jgi:acylaminoacyl-peptidase